MAPNPISHADGQSREAMFAFVRRQVRYGLPAAVR